MKKYKLTLLKDLPTIKAGTELLNVKFDDPSNKYPDYGELEEIYYLRDKPEWVKVEEDTRCDCQTRKRIWIRSEVIGYGRSFCVSLDFEDKEIYTWYDHRCDSGSAESLPIKYCPLCGRKLDEVNS